MVIVSLQPLHRRAVDPGEPLECYSCGALVSELAEFLDERGEIVRLCEECEDDVLEEIAELRAERDVA